MRSPTLLSAFLLLTTTTLTSADPFSPLPIAEFSPAQNAQNLFRRQQVDACQPNYYSCGYRDSTGRDTGSCCSTDAVCTLDNAGQVACCPLGAFCTGTITPPTPAPTRTLTTTGGTTVVAGGPITPPPNPGPGGYVDNEYYAFPVLWQEGANLGDQQQCVNAYATCNAWYDQCTNALQGRGGTGLTVDAPQGGITVGGNQGQDLGVQSATSICGSLRNEGCPGNGATCAGPQASPTGFIVVNPQGGAGGLRSRGGRTVMALAVVVAWAVAAW